MDASSKHYPTMQEIRSETAIQIKIHWYSFPHHWPMAKALLKPVWFVATKLPNLLVPKIDYLSRPVSVFQKVPGYRWRPNWSDFIALSYWGTDYPLGSQTTVLPLINLSLSDESCIYSALLLVTEETCKCDIVTPSVTFNQPLCVKAVKIIQTKDLNIVSSLGGCQSHELYRKHRYGDRGFEFGESLREYLCNKLNSSNVR